MSWEIMGQLHECSSEGANVMACPRLILSFLCMELCILCQPHLLSITAFLLYCILQHLSTQNDLWVFQQSQTILSITG